MTSTGSSPGSVTPVEQALAAVEQHGNDVEQEFVDRTCRERLPHRRGTAGDVDVAGSGRLRLLEGGVEAGGNEVERRPAVHLDRLVRIVGEDEHRCVVRRLVAPPPTPVTVPLAPDRAEHVAAHDVRAPAAQQLVPRTCVRFVTGLAGVKVPFMKLHAPDPDRVVAALVRSGDEAVERDGHVTGNKAHADQDCQQD